MLGAVACGPGRAHVPPPDVSVETWILARQAGAGASPWDLAVHPGAGAWTATLPEDEITYLLGYARTAEELGLGPTRVPECAVQRPEHAWRLTAEDDDWGWRSASELPETLTLALVHGSDRCDVCAPIPMRAVSAPHNHRYYGLAWFDDGSALGAFLLGLARVRSDRIELLSECMEPVVGPTSLASLGGDRFLVGGQQGHLAVIRFPDGGDRCVVETSTQASPEGLTPFQQQFPVLAANPDEPARFDYYALRASGELYHWSEAGLRSLGRQALHPQAEHADPAVLLRLDGRRALTGVGNRQVTFWEDGEPAAIETLDLPPLGVSNTPRDRVTALFVDARAGRYLAGTAAGELWARPLSDVGWSYALRLPSLEAVGTVVEFGERYLVFLNGGDVATFDREGTVCARTQRTPGSSNSGAGRRVLQRDGRLLLGDAIGSSSGKGGAVWIE